MANDVSANPQTGRIEVEVFGVDLDGQQFIEQTRTVTVTRDGATIGLANKLAPDSELIIRNPSTNEETAARVVDIVKDAIFVQVYGIAFMEPSANLWRIEFSETQPAEPTRMECGSCHAVDAAMLSEIESEIFAAKQSLRRACECSTSPTIWKQTDRRVTERRSVARGSNDRRQNDASTQESIPQDPRERRKEKRTSMKAIACIRCCGEEILVECEDMSRGGFRFRNQKRIPAGMPIAVAVPYSKSGVNIFVSAEIAYHQKLSAGFFRHGVSYVKSVKIWTPPSPRL